MRIKTKNKPKIALICRKKIVHGTINEKSMVIARKIINNMKKILSFRDE